MNLAELFRRILPELAGGVVSALASGSRPHGALAGPVDALLHALEKALACGDPRLLDQVIEGWSRAEARDELSENGAAAWPVFGTVAQASLTIAYRELDAREAAALMGALLPLLFHGEQRLTASIHQQRFDQISGELRETVARLEHLDRTKSNFISIAGHELRTPLTLIEGYAAMLAEGLPRGGVEAEPLLGGIQLGAQRLKVIIDDMIDVALIDSDLLALKCQPLRVGPLLRSLAREYSRIAGQRQIKLQLATRAADDVLIFADSARLRQALRNLLNNAVKYTPNGGRITIRGKALSGFVEIMITDTGIGLDLHDQASIFEKFEQLGEVSLHSTGKTKFKGDGPGLGLPISRGIIRAHGGQIWVESAGHDEVQCPGTTFHVLLPRRSPSMETRLAKLNDQEQLAITP